MEYLIERRKEFLHGLFLKKNQQGVSDSIYTTSERWFSVTTLYDSESNSIISIIYRRTRYIVQLWWLIYFYEDGLRYELKIYYTWFRNIKTTFKGKVYERVFLERCNSMCILEDGVSVLKIFNLGGEFHAGSLKIEYESEDNFNFLTTFLIATYDSFYWQSD